MNMKFFNSRRFKHGSLATVITVVFIAAVVLVNVIVGIIFEKYPLNIDLTKEGRFELTQESINFVEDLGTNVELFVCADEDFYSGYNSYYKQSYEIIKNYSRYSNKIKVSFIDLVKNPNFAKQYSDITFTEGDILVKSNLREKKITSSSLFSSSQNPMTGEAIYSSKAEQILTSAIMYVTDNDPVTVALLTGMGNVDVSGYTSLLTSNNYSIVEQNLLTEEINNETSFAILPQPASDISSEQAAKLDKYLDNDSKFGKSLIFIASPTQEVGPVLKAFLAEWGMEIGNDVIYENDQSHVISNQFTFITEINNADLKTAMNTQLPVVAIEARPIKLLFETSDNRSTAPLISSYNTTSLLPIDADSTFDFSSQPQGAHPVVAMGTRLKYENTTALKSNVICVSALSVLDQSILSMSTFGNTSAMVSITNNVAEKKETVQILPVTFDNNVITVTGWKLNVNRIVFVFVIPIGVIALGLIIWLRRRHL